MDTLLNKYNYLEGGEKNIQTSSKLHSEFVLWMQVKATPYIH